MAKYFVYEGNIDTLEKKVEKIRKKCEKYNCLFIFGPTGEEEYRKVKLDDEEFLARFVEYEAYGVAKCEKGWSPVAIIDHTYSEGNTIKTIGTIPADIPEMYYTSDPVCEHCNTNRRRTTTVLIYNTITGQFKQVGKSCLLDYTGGLDADLITLMAQYIDAFESYGDVTSGKGVHHEHYYSSLDVVALAVKNVNEYGYEKYDPYENPRFTTKNRVLSDLNSTETVIRKQDKEEAIRLMTWIRNEAKIEGEYFHNLHTLGTSRCIKESDVGILVSIVPAYNNYLAKLERDKEREAETHSEYVGQIKEKVDVHISSKRLVSEIPHEFGTTYLYKFISIDGNVFIWYSSRYVGDIDKWNSLKGTVKDHSEFRGIKQTVLTRCKGTV